MSEKEPKHPLQIYAEDKIAELKHSIDALTDMKSCLSDVDNRREDLDIAIDSMEKEIIRLKRRYL